MAGWLLAVLLLPGCVSDPPDNLSHIGNKGADNDSAGVVIILAERSKIAEWPTDGPLVNQNFPEITYVDDDGIEQRYSSKVLGVRDTLHLQLSRPTISVAHSYFQMDRFNYLFCNGDTVVFTYDDDIPIARLKQRSSSDFNLNYEFTKRRKFGQTESLQGQFYYDLNTLYQHTDAENRQFARDANVSFEEERQLLDSLRSAGVMDVQNYTYQINRLAFEQYNCSLSPQYGSLFRQYVPAGFIRDHLHDDNLAYHQYYLEAVSDWVIKRFKIPSVSSSSAHFPHYLSAFDSVFVHQGIFSPLVSKLLLNRLASKTMENFAVEDARYVIEKVAKISDNDRFYKRLSHDYRFINYVRSVSGEEETERSPLRDQNSPGADGDNPLQLLTVDSKASTLEEVLAAHRENVIYVEFWASWCTPCRRAMPASINLRKDYQDRGVRVIYLSTDRNLGNWERAIEQEHLESYADNYLMVNQEVATFINDIDLGTIPRYLIFDQQGNLVHPNAPGPETDEIRLLLDRYLDG